VKHKAHEIKEDKIVVKLFNSIINILHDIYKKYFIFKIKKSNEGKKMEMQIWENSLFEFLRDFEIFPALINKSKVYSLWTQVLEKINDGRDPIYKNCSTKESKYLFSFYFFLDFIALISITAYIEDGTSEVGHYSLMV